MSNHLPTQSPNRLMIRTRKGTWRHKRKRPLSCLRSSTLFFVFFSPASRQRIGGENRTFQPCPQTRSCPAAQSHSRATLEQESCLHTVGLSTPHHPDDKPPVDRGTCARWQEDRNQHCCERQCSRSVVLVLGRSEPPGSYCIPSDSARSDLSSASSFVAYISAPMSTRLW
jgi:hypothetical protein